MEWVRIKDRAPDKNGLYRVLISGDSESQDGHTVYEFDDYETFMTIWVDEEGVGGTGFHDEEYETVLAWYGPLEIPRFK